MLNDPFKTHRTIKQLAFLYNLHFLIFVATNLGQGQDQDQGQGPQGVPGGQNPGKKSWKWSQVKKSSNNNQK